MSDFYVYAFLDPNKPGYYEYDGYIFDYQPFYIGKGKGNRIKKHKIYMKTDDSLKYRKYKKIQENGKEPIVKKVIENIEEKDAFLLEINLIKNIGRIDLKTGPLCNLTEGGEGCSGRKLCNDTKEKISNSVKKCGRIYKPHIKEFKQMMS